MIAVPKIDDQEEDDGLVEYVVDPEFFACEECQGECRGHAFDEPLQTLVAAMEIGLHLQPEPTDEHDEVPLPSSGSDVWSFMAEFDELAGSWGTWDLSKREWKTPFMHGSGGAWAQRIKRQRIYRGMVLALLRVILLAPDAWRSIHGWDRAIDNAWVRSKLARCGYNVSASAFQQYIRRLRDYGEIECSRRNEPYRRARSR